jgi:hypothetical protein
VVSAELGIGTLEGWVSRGLWLLDTRWHTENQQTSVESVGSRPFWRILRIGDHVPVTMGFFAAES